MSENHSSRPSFRVITVSISKAGLSLRWWPILNLSSPDSLGIMTLHHLETKCTLAQSLVTAAAMGFNAIQYNTMQYNTVQCSVMQCNAMQRNTIQHNTIQCNTTPYPTLPPVPHTPPHNTVSQVCSPTHTKKQQQVTF